MKKSIAMKWAKALESGKYKKGTVALRNYDDTYCCLGVLCDITPGSKWRRSDLGRFSLTVYNNGETSEAVLPTQIANLHGMSSTDGNIPSIGKSLAALNDQKYKTFKPIAKLIRKHYKEL